MLPSNICFKACKLFNMTFDQKFFIFMHILQRAKEVNNPKTSFDIIMEKPAGVPD